jgi:nitroimidazol reductase NimA-like FMN-containing flavoprotein (pyridoxamine 5'-phosphate oxidase superfamily)
MVGTGLSYYTRTMSEDKKFHVARHDEREVFDRDAINRLLDNQYVAHVGFIDQDNQMPFVIPMGVARDNDRILLHGSTGSRMMRQIAQGIDLCVTVTQLNAIVVARSAFNSSMNYESVMIFGVARVLEDAEKDVALERITEKLVPGLWNYGRPLVAKEMAATMIVELSLDKISAKSRTGDPSDDDEDLALPIWAGLLPIETKVGTPITAANAAAIPVPSHIA